MQDLAGQRFGRLEVVAFTDSKHGNTRWRCRCDCGQERVILRHQLLRGRAKSCGCWMREKNAALLTKRATRHGHSVRKHRTPEYRAWINMRRRCEEETNISFKWYGGRGIKVCERWQTFENFLADVGARPVGTTLDRFPDNDGNYEPGNVRWATPKEQANNRRKAARRAAT